MSENKRNLTEKEEYYKLITDEKSNHIGTNANGAGSQCVRRKNIGILSFRERYLSLRQRRWKSASYKLTPTFWSTFNRRYVKSVKVLMCSDFQLVTSIFGIFEANSTPSNQSNTPYH